SPYEVWRDKTGKTTPEEKHAVAELEQVQLGTLLEPKIAEMYTIRTGRKVARVNQPIVNAKFPSFMRGNIDRRVVGQQSLLECKNVGYHMAQKAFGEAGTDEVPEYQLIQVMYYLMLKEYPEGELAALLGGNTFRIFNILFDAELGELMRQAGEYFWTENVLKDIPPPASTYDDLNSLYAKSRPGLPVIATDEIKIAALEAARLR
ncbi:MAG: YqaJ viral recombinase family protein, partial [Candidatus Omnitrophica bacterium]|nr:YqaJ viral recombinase family protein [Candidatus Omnitrophota bacterium]